MAYLTHYELAILEGGNLIESVIEKESKGNFELDYSLNESGYTKEPSKWYEHESDMKKISMKYPELTFELSGEGENSDDSWIKLFKNGRMTLK